MTVPFSWELPYAWPRKPVLARNVVCTSQPLAAQAGLAMLADGGSAVDAALAAAITLTLVEPVSTGIGSDAFAIVWDGEGLHGLNASGRSPALWTREYFRGGPVPTRGWNSVTVPGAVSAWTELHSRFGRLPFARVFAPAIGYGSKGFLVSPTVAAQWAGQVPELRSQAGFAEAFLPGGRAPAAGERFRFPEHAATLETIAATAGEAFYRGELAAAMQAHSTSNGGAMMASDLAAHRADWVDPISVDYRGYTLHEIPPNGQGIVALISLGILQHFDMASLPVDSADSVHLQIEAIKLAFADALAYVADIDHMPVRPKQLLDADYLRERSTLIDPAWAAPVSAGRPPKGGTVYLTAADADGMMVSMIQRAAENSHRRYGFMNDRDGFHPDLTGSNAEHVNRSLRARVHHVRTSELSAATAQTMGMQRFAAISGGSVGSEKIWMGETYVRRGRCPTTTIMANPRRRSSYEVATPSSYSMTAFKKSALPRRPGITFLSPHMFRIEKRIQTPTIRP